MKPKSVDAISRTVEELERATNENRDQIKQIIAAIRQLMTPLEKTRREIGFHTKPEEADPPANRRRIGGTKARQRTGPVATR